MFDTDRLYPLPGGWDVVGNTLVSYEYNLFLTIIDGVYVLEDFHGNKEVFSNKKDLIKELSKHE